MKEESEIVLSSILSRTQDIITHYTKSTGIPCRIILENSKDNEFCHLCSLWGNKAHSEKCKSIHLHSAKQSERFGGSFIYFCPAYLLYWSSPIIYEGTMLGAVTAGPALIVPEDDVIDELHKLFPDKNVTDLRDGLSQIVKIDTAKSRSLAELLFMCTGWVNDTIEHQMLESRKYQNQQAKISEYIHELKESSFQEIPPYPIEKEEELLSSIVMGNKGKAQRILNEILGNVFFSSGRNFEIIKFRILELIVLLSRAAIEGGGDPNETLALNYRYLREIEQFRSVESLSFWLSEVLNRFSSLVFDLHTAKHVDRLERALHYINSHYTEKISLEDTASYAALSPAYFSRIFKEEMNTSFTSYINKIRVDHAKTLLKTTPCTLIEIAGLVGFEDQSYFSRVFKQIAGISPGKYRESSSKTLRSNQEIH